MLGSDINKPRQDSATPGYAGKKSIPISAPDKNSVVQLSIQHLVVSFLVVESILLLVCGLVPYWYLELGYGNAYNPETATIEFEAIFLAGFIFLLVSRVTGSYSTHSILEFNDVIPRLALAVTLTFAILMLIVAATKTTHQYSRLWFFSWFVSSGVLILGFRSLRLAWARRLLARRGCVYRAISVGISCRAMRPDAIAQLTQNKVRCFQALEFDAIGDIASLSELIKHEIVDQIYICVPWQRAPEVMQKIGVLRHLAADIFVFPKEWRTSANLVGLSQFGDQLGVQVTAQPINGWDLWFKRMQDIVISSLALFIFGPAMVAIAFAIKLESQGPIITRQKCLGFNGAAFEIFKFRSTYYPANYADGRLTWVGRGLRAFHLDVLPQFFNILRGTMSVVGPQPHPLTMDAEGELFYEAIDGYALRRRVKPGLTGWAQVSGYDGELDNLGFMRRANLDLEYIDNWSFVFDLRIILRAIGNLLQ
jgi:exopolysaccharide biosynthesis polyprenyl glycosylphosphotransferase